MGKDGNGNRESTRTIDILLQNERERAKQGLLKCRQGRWRAVRDEPVRASVSSLTCHPRTYRSSAEMLSKIY